jgi:crotonobetainyl-CoA:carnitine CoA-transferase CaiB-like acyl-CoA transferase
MDSKAQPLRGIVVLDFTTLLPGPLATLMLAEAGADVIKVERPGGEEVRRFPPQIDGESAIYALLNRGKKSIVVDLKAADARARLAPLIARSDVVVEQFRPGVMAPRPRLRRRESHESARRLLLDYGLWPGRLALQ